MDTSDKKETMIDLIREDHKFYTDNISVNAASIECCSYLISLYATTKPKRILDLGSGISSYCVRLYKKLNNLVTEIYSVDTQTAWLQKSRIYCHNREVDTDNFVTWDNFKNHTEPFDLIFVDIDMSPERKLYFEPVFNQLSKPGTMVMLDDMHKSAIGYPFDKLMKIRTDREINIKKQTIDELGRYSRLIKVGGK